MKLSAVSLLSLMLPAASAHFPAGADPIVLNKDIHTASVTAPGIEHGDRNLQLTVGKLTTRCFTECVELSMTPEQCKAFIELQVATAIGGHEVGPLTVKIHDSRTEEELAETYWLVEVPVNLLGRTTCDRNEGKTVYQFGWNTESGTMPVASVDCLNLKASDCCKKIRAYGMGLGMDTNGMCLACFPHQEPLVPRVATNDSTGVESVVFEDYLFDGNTCFKAPYSEPAVNFFDNQKRTSITGVVADIDNFLSLPSGTAHCGLLSFLLDALYDATVTVPEVQLHLGRLSCGWCWSETTIMDMDGLKAQLQLIRNILDPTPVFDSTERVVIIYADRAKNIVDIPKVGGSRADDEFDDDCPPDTASDPELGSCLQANDSWSTPCLPGFIFDDLVNSYVCPATTSLINCTGETIENTLEFVDRVVVDLGNDVFKTQFIYKACTPQLDCGAAGQRQLRGQGEVSEAERQLLLGGLLGGGGTGTGTGGVLGGGVGGVVDGVLSLVDNLLSPMNSISIGMVGKCVVTDFAYISLDVNTPIAGAEIELKLADIGLNTDTCIAGFSFTADWSTIQSTGCQTGDFCRNIMLEVDGIAPLVETEASVSFSNAFSIFPTMGPDCTLCEPEV